MPAAAGARPLRRLRARAGGHRSPTSLQHPPPLLRLPRPPPRPPPALRCSGAEARAIKQNDGLAFPYLATLVDLVLGPEEGQQGQGPQAQRGQLGGGGAAAALDTVGDNQGFRWGGRGSGLGWHGVRGAAR